MTASTHTGASIALRTGAALLGGYACTWGFAALLITAQVAWLDVSYDEARTLAHLLAFLVYLGAFLWAFCTARVARAWLVLGAGGAAMAALAAWLSSTILSA